MHGVQNMLRGGLNDRGAALITVLLFMMLTFILITTMLVSTRNEVVIAGLHRDGVRATEMAHAGLQEAISRLQFGRNVPPDLVYTFNSSLNSPRGTATITYRLPVSVGPSGDYREIVVNASAGKANREVRAIVLVKTALFIPNNTLGDGIRQPGNPNPIRSGDVYSRSFVQYQELPSNAGLPEDKKGVTYAGWRVSRCKDPLCSNSADPDRILPCYTHAACSAIDPGWYPGTRLSESEKSEIGKEIVQWGRQHCSPDGKLIGDVPTQSDPRAEVQNGTGDYFKYGFTKDDRTFDNKAIPAQIDLKKFPCGLPYKYVQHDVVDETTQISTRQTLFFKTIVFEQWLDSYWEFKETSLSLVKKPSLKQYPEMGAIPPYPDTYLTQKNFDVTLKPADVGPANIGCHVPEMTCASGKSELVAAWVDGNWVVNKPGGLRGHGMLLVDGDLTIDNLGASFAYWGVIIVRGKLRVNTGQMIIHGGLIAQDVVTVNGNFTIDGGGGIATTTVGTTTVTVKAWYER